MRIGDVSTRVLTMLTRQWCCERCALPHTPISDRILKVASDLKVRLRTKGDLVDLVSVYLLAFNLEIHVISQNEGDRISHLVFLWPRSYEGMTSSPLPLNIPTHLQDPGRNSPHHARPTYAGECTMETTCICNARRTQCIDKVELQKRRRAYNQPLLAWSEY